MYWPYPCIDCSYVWTVYSVLDNEAGRLVENNNEENKCSTMCSPCIFAQGKFCPINVYLSQYLKKKKKISRPTYFGAIQWIVLPSAHLSGLEDYDIFCTDIYWFRGVTDWHAQHSAWLTSTSAPCCWHEQEDYGQERSPLLNCVIGKSRCDCSVCLSSETLPELSPTLTQLESISVKAPLADQPKVWRFYDESFQSHKNVKNQLQKWISRLSDYLRAYLQHVQ